ncbi:MAG: LCP family protein [Acidimicrobiia bacterium]|nr:LCP family protein [Acidimicrobiia bacterium]
MRRHPLVGAVLSAVIPGAGQLYAGDPYRAAIVFSPAVLVVTGLYSFADRGTIGMGELLVQPAFLSGLLAANAAVLVWRIAAAVDAYLILSRGNRRSPVFAVALITILGVLALPQIVGWVYGARAIAALNTVFVASPPVIEDPGPIVVDPVFTTSLDNVRHPAFVDIPDVDPRSSRNMIFREGVGDPDAIAALGDIYAPATPFAPFVPVEERVDTDRLTILLVGGDAGPGRDGLRTDSMNVVTIDLDTGAVAMFGLPRNLKEVPLPRHLRGSFVRYEQRVRERDLRDADFDGYPDAWVDRDGDEIPDEPPFVSCRCFPEMLNKVHQKTYDWTRTYPNEVDPGLAALRDVVSHLLDIEIDYYFMVEMAGFVRTIDALGGVDVYVDEPYHVMVSAPEEGQPKAKINVEPGMNRLSGLEALAYSRWRIGSSDYDRMGRQRCVVKAAVTQADTLTLVQTLPELLDLMEQYVTTDIPVSFLPDLVRIAGTIDYDNIATVGLTPPRYSAGRTPGKYPIPNVSRMRAKVQDVIENGVVAQSSTGASECDPAPPEE